MKTRSTRMLATVVLTTTTLVIGILAAFGATTVAPPPRFAFVADGNGFPDALTVGPMAGRLGAPLFLNRGDTLSEMTRQAIVAYNPDIVIVAGGLNSVAEAVVDAISTAAGLPVATLDDAPPRGVIRVSGSGREETAAALAGLLAKYNPAFLPADAKAADADLLDGKDSSAFLGATAKAADADKLDGIDATAFAKTGPVTVAYQRNWLAETGRTSGGISDFTDGVLLDDAGDSYPFHLQLTAPSLVGEVRFGLATVEICYSAQNASSFIDVTAVSRTTSTGTTAVITDVTDRTALTPTVACYSLDIDDTPPADAVYVLALSVNLQVKVTQVTATFTPT